MILLKVNMKLLMFLIMVSGIVSGNPLFANDTNIYEKNLIKSEAWLNDNSKRNGVIVTESGLQYKALVATKGCNPDPKYPVILHYESFIAENNYNFDSSYARKKPIKANLNKMIVAWEEGIPLMREGETWEFYVHPKLAYGVKGAGKTIKPNVALMFRVNLLSVEKCKVNTHDTVTTSAVFNTLPERVNDWVGENKFLDLIYSELFKYDEYLITDYRKNNDETVNVYMTYYKKQKINIPNYSAKYAIPFGYDVVKERTINAKDIVINGNSLRANMVTIKRNEKSKKYSPTNLLTIYWAQFNDKSIPTNDEVYNYLNTNDNNTAGGLIRFTTKIRTDEKVDAARERILILVKSLVKYMPTHYSN